MLPQTGRRSHSLWCNPNTGAVETVPRHGEIANHLAAGYVGGYRFQRLGSDSPSGAQSRTEETGQQAGAPGAAGPAGAVGDSPNDGVPDGIPDNGQGQAGVERRQPDAMLLKLNR